MILNCISFSPTSVTLSDILLIFLNSTPYHLYTLLTEYFLEHPHLSNQIILLLDLLLRPLRRPDNLREPLCDRLIIVFDVVLHGYLELLDCPLQLLLLLLSVPLLTRLNQLQETVPTRYLSLVVLDELVDLRLQVAED
jgi:hypothetical protein